MTNKPTPASQPSEECLNFTAQEVSAAYQRGIAEGIKRAKQPSPARSDMPEAERLLNMVANKGGSIVPTSALSGAEIAAAGIENRMAVREDGCGFVYMPVGRYPERAASTTPAGSAQERQNPTGAGDFRERFEEAYSMLSAAVFASPFWNQSMEELLSVIQSEINKKVQAERAPSGESIDGPEFEAALLSFVKALTGSNNLTEYVPAKREFIRFIDAYAARRAIAGTATILRDALLAAREMVGHPDNVAFIDKALIDAGDAARVKDRS